MVVATYHLQSIALTMVVVSTVTLLCLAPALLRFADEFRGSLRAWIIGTALVVSTDIIFFLGPEVTYLNTILTAIAGLGSAEWIHALRLYTGRPGRALWPYAVIAVGTAISFASPSYPTSVLVTSSVFACLYLGAAACASGIREPERSAGRTLLIAVFTFIALVMLGRLGLFATGIRSGAPAGYTSPIRALMFIVASIAPIAGSFAFVLAAGERLGDRLLRWSLTDSLTGIPNRRAFIDVLERAISTSRRRTEPLALLAIDLDHFKHVNDSAGHQAGDEALVEVAALLVKAGRASDTVGRLGGEEFAVVVPGADLAAASAVADRLRQTVASTPIVARGRPFDLTASFGVVLWNGEEEAYDLISRADRLLYKAKDAGRDRVITQADER